MTLYSVVDYMQQLKKNYFSVVRNNFKSDGAADTKRSLTDLPYRSRYVHVAGRLREWPAREF